jgi:hypothetical protein
MASVFASQKCIEPWRVPWTNMMDFVLIMANILLTESSLDTPRQSLGTRDDRILGYVRQLVGNGITAISLTTH